MKKCVLLLMVLFPLIGFSQYIIKGIVVDQAGKPVPNASAFLSNTSFGTKADDNGNFQLTIPAGKYDLVVSSVGFQTHTQTIQSGEIAKMITIILKVKESQLETVIIEPYEKNGWDKWGLFFTENFIGTSSNALDCWIKNKDAIKFRHSKKYNQLIAIATEPLIIENKALGYTITLQLENFSYDFSTRYMIYIGYAWFEEMKGSKSKKRKWEKARQDAYYGSMMHFMRSLYMNKIKEEGFEIRRLHKVGNTEKQRIKAMYASNIRRTPGSVIVVQRQNSDSADYYDRILGQEDEFNVIGRDILPADSIAYALDSTTAILEFENYLLVFYNKVLAPFEYRRQYPKSNPGMMSQITLVNNKPVQVEASGNYYDPSELLSTGYWAWSEKISMMLPLDFDPSKTNGKD